jgi:hypothetical protein
LPPIPVALSYLILSALPPPPTQPYLALPFPGTGGRLPSSDCAGSLSVFTAPVIATSPISSPRLWHVSHLPHLLRRPQESSELIVDDHASPPPANVSTTGRTTACTVLRCSDELHCLQPCLAGRSYPASTLSRLSSPPCRPSCCRWLRHRTSPVRGDRSITRAGRASVTSWPRSLEVWVGLPRALVAY